jgi:hypothetical protein
LKPITICLPFYMNAGMLKEQCRRFRALPDEMKAGLHLIVVDDGSPSGRAEHEDIGFPFELYRMLVDIRWNQDACRNLAVSKATTDWVLLTDMDHIAPAETLAALVNTKHDPGRTYRFARMTLMRQDEDGQDWLEPYKPHPNSWFMTRERYWAIGGYDERLAGLYGTDADFRNRVVAGCGRVIDLPEYLIRVPRDTIPDASTTTYGRKEPQDLRLKALLRERAPNWRPEHFRFPWERVA